MSIRDHARNDDFFSDERGICGNCEDEYEPYVVLVKDNFVAICEYVEIEKHFGYLCSECRKEYAKSGEYAIIDEPNQEEEQ